MNNNQYFKERATTAIGILGCACSASLVVDTAIHAYTAAGRDYHGLSHGENMAQVSDDDMKALGDVSRLSEHEKKWVWSITVLGGLFHDLVYLQCDHKTSDTVLRILAKDVEIGQPPAYTTTIKNDLTQQGKLVCDLFGFKPGQTVSLSGSADYHGLNEFLSALTAVHLLTGEESIKTAGQTKALIAVAAIIEATIPFRDSSALNHLNDRLLALGLNEREALLTTQAAALHANKDVESFSGDDFKNATKREKLSRFIMNTWQLVPEGRPAFQGQDYSPQEFRAILQTWHSFLSTLNPETIFHAFRGVPQRPELWRKTEAAKYMVHLQMRYLKAKISSASLVEASINTEPQTQGKSLWDCVDRLTVGSFPAQSRQRFTSEDKLVLSLLIHRGDPGTYAWDKPYSPVATYLMRSIGPKGIEELHQCADTYLTNAAPDYAGFLARATHLFPQQVAMVRTRILALQEGRQATHERPQTRPADNGCGLKHVPHS